MCGRADVDEHGPSVIWISTWTSGLGPLQLVSNHDLRPTQSIPVVRLDDNTRTAALARWGFERVHAGRRVMLFNARAETAAALPSFRTAYRQQRCVVPVDAFFEWSGPKGSRQRHRITRTDSAPVLLAGLWELAPDVGLACTVLTCVPNATLAPIHNRMPVVLHEQSVDRWLAPEVIDPTAVQPPAVPCPDDWLQVADA